MLQAVADKPPSVLLIDDALEDVRSLVDLMTARRWRIQRAFDGRDGYRKALLHQPDLVLLEVRLPVMDGFATGRRLKAHGETQAIPLIFLTAADGRQDRLQGLSIGAVDYIVKQDASDEEVLTRVEIHLRLAGRLAERGMASPQGAPSDGGEGPEGALAPVVRAAVAVLRDQIANPPSPDGLARQVGTNERRLNDAFRSTFGLPVYGWLREERLRVACHLLTRTLMPVADVAAACGYSSAANFATAFRERMGCTPRDYRREPTAAVPDAQPPAPDGQPRAVP